MQCSAFHALGTGRDLLIGPSQSIQPYARFKCKVVCGIGIKFVVLNDAVPSTLLANPLQELRTVEALRAISRDRKFWTLPFYLGAWSMLV